MRNIPIRSSQLKKYNYACFIPTSPFPNRKQRRQYLQKANRNPGYRMFVDHYQWEHLFHPEDRKLPINERRVIGTKRIAHFTSYDYKPKN